MIHSGIRVESKHKAQGKTQNETVASGIGGGKIQQGFPKAREK
jgi:hypothetical protein